MPPDRGARGDVATVEVRGTTACGGGNRGRRGGHSLRIFQWRQPREAAVRGHVADQGMARSLALLESTGYPSPFRGAVACEELNGAGDRGALVAALGRFGRPARHRRRLDLIAALGTRPTRPRGASAAVTSRSDVGKCDERDGAVPPDRDVAGHAHVGAPDSHRDVRLLVTTASVAKLVEEAAGLRGAA